MSRVVRYSPCPQCRERGKDSRGDNRVEYADGGSHCFSCGFHSWGNMVSRFRDLVVEKHDSKVLPSDFTRDVEPEGWKWLLQYGLPYSYWKESVGYSKAFGRLVFPIGRPGAPVFSIGRLIDESRDEHKRKWKVWGNCHTYTEVVGQGDVTCLVEDLLSAHKIGQIVESIPLFGTTIHPCHLNTLRKAPNKPLVLWLDKDQEGGTKKKALRLQMLVNRPVFVKHTEKDPKCLSVQEIKEVLYEVF